jgi:hypothetical protein
MGAVVDFVEDVVGGVVEAVGDVVEDVVDVVDDVVKAVDTYVVQPILDDPVSAIATVAAAYYLGPAAATYFGTSAAVGTGIAAGAANAAAGLAQGESFDEAIKGGFISGVTAGGAQALFGGAGGEAVPSDVPVDVSFPSEGPIFSDVPLDVPVDVPVATAYPVSPQPDITATDLPPFESAAPASTAPAPSTTAPSPLQQLSTPAPAAAAPVEIPTFTAPEIPSTSVDYGLSSGMKPDLGLQYPTFTPDTSGFNLYGDANYSLVPEGLTSGPGLQPSGAPNLASMRGGQGLTADMQGLPSYTENGLPTTFTGSSGQTYGAATPDVTVSSSGIAATPSSFAYDPLTNMGTPKAFDQFASGDIFGAGKTIGGNVVDWAKTNPWTAAATGLGAASILGGSAPQSSTPPPKGSTQDNNFNKSLDLYNYMRDKTNYAGDLTKYGQVGQADPREHQFFQNTKFVPIPIPGQATPAKMGGLIQMKHFAQGGMAQGMQDPRRAQLMQAMAQQRPAGQGGPMGMAQGRPPMMQGGAMPQRPMSPENAQGQGMQQRPQMPQRPRDPKMAYYQYGNPPVQAKAMGGLSQVQSMRIGGGADGRSDDVNAVLSDGEYVMDAESVAMLGNGSSKAGAAKLDQMRSKLRQHKGKNLASGKISPNAKSPLAYLKGA